MFSYLIVALFALLSLSVSSRPLQLAISSLSPCDLHTVSANVTAPSSVPSILPSFISSSPIPTTDDCSEYTSASLPTSVPSTTTAAPSTSVPPTTTTAPTTSVVSTPATSSAPASTSAALTVASDASTTSFTGGQATYFYQNGNPGACGQVHSDYDFICAMDQIRFGTSGPASPLCGQQVELTNANTGVSIVVTIADDCPTCLNENSIDLSVGAFQALAPLSEGVFPITWYYK